MRAVGPRLPGKMLIALANLYRRRIVNINVNIIAAGFLALIPTLAAVHFSRYLGVDDHDKKLISIITFVADVVSDVIIYYILHWLANHSPAATRGALEKAEHMVRAGAIVTDHALEKVVHPRSFLRDATRVQIERMCLSPVLYGVLFATQQFMLHAGYDRVWATTLAFVAGISITRAIHTAWMVYQERREARALAAPSDAARSPAPLGSAAAPHGRATTADADRPARAEADGVAAR